MYQSKPWDLNYTYAGTGEKYLSRNDSLSYNTYYYNYNLTLIQTVGQSENST
jgi:hypothetical protein